jgi:hypothetical protein
MISQHIIDAKKIIGEIELLTAYGTILDDGRLFKKSTDLIKVVSEIVNEADRIANGYSK